MITFQLPAWPILPAWLNRRPVEPKPAPWPGNPATVADDLRIAQANEVHLARLLVEARQDADVEAARAAAFERRATEADAALELARTQGADLHRELRKVTADRDALRGQLEKSFGYTKAELTAIANGTGQPRS